MTESILRPQARQHIHAGQQVNDVKVKVNAQQDGQKEQPYDNRNKIFHYFFVSNCNSACSKISWRILGAVRPRNWLSGLRISRCARVSGASR
jgi:hypothetical protein